MTETTQEKQPEWKDVTGYSRGDTERVPRVWEMRSGPVCVTVHRAPSSCVWFLTCRDIKLVDHELSARSVEAAKAEALNVAYGRAYDVYRTLREVLGD